MTISAFIFDVDGTLVDTNDLHARAWQEAFEQHGFKEPLEAIRERIGMGGDRIVPQLEGEQIEAKLGEKLRHTQSERFTQLLQTAPKRTFPMVPELFAALRERGIALAVATSSEPKNFETLQRAFQIEIAASVDHVVTAGGEEESKPAPDLVLKAVAELRREPAECLMVGDTPYDALASTRAGVGCVGVLSGGWAEADLKKAGAGLVYRDTGELLERLDQVLSRFFRPL